MKTFLVFLMIITSMAITTTQEEATVKATFNEHLAGNYYFTDEDDSSLEFTQITQEVLEAFNLLSDEFKGKVFMITYTSDTEEDEEGDDITIDTIVALKLIE